MSSGYGKNGGRGRCFPFFQEFTKCFIQADSKAECQLQLDDYYECMYHRKELLRLWIVQKEWEKKQAKENPAPAGFFEKFMK